MKLYYAPGACSLADHIALREAGLAHDLVEVDLKSHRTEAGDDYYAINPKGYVPALELDDGQGILTENIAILDWIAERAPALMPRVALARTRLIETLAFISTELHKSFAPFFADGSDAAKRAAADKIARRLDLIARELHGDYLFGGDFTVADAYLFVMLTWARKNELPLPAALEPYFDRVSGRDAVRTALQIESDT